MNLMDTLVSSADLALRTLTGSAHAARPMPLATTPDAELTPEERRLSGALMRVNHVGEVCAQALYAAQGITARSEDLRAQMQAAGREETDHLAWTEQRLRELGGRTSLLNPLWFAGAFAIGLVAAKAGDKISLGFVIETERQVEQHLNSHMARLPEGDADSRAIVAQMRDDEIAHAQAAQASGGVALPAPVRGLMRLAAKVMTATAHRI